MAPPMEISFRGTGVRSIPWYFQPDCFSTPRAISSTFFAWVLRAAVRRSPAEDKSPPVRVRASAATFADSRPTAKPCPAPTVEETGKKGAFCGGKARSEERRVGKEGKVGAET